jgi:hypothetical protein
MIEIFWIWNYFKEKRFGRFIAAGLIGGIVLVTVQHFSGVENSKSIKYYFLSIAIGILSGASCGLIVFIADFGNAFNKVCSRSNSILIRVLPLICTITIGIIGFILLIVICLMVLFWSNLVYGFHLFGFK